MKNLLPTVHVLYENPAWLPPLTVALDAEGFPKHVVTKPNSTGEC